MRRPTKILFFFLGLVVLSYTGFTFWLIYHHMYLDTRWAIQLGLTKDIFYTGFYTTLSFALLTALVGFGLIIRALTAKRRDHRLQLTTDSGSVQITEDAMTSCMRSTLADYSGIVEADIKLDLNNKAQRIRAKLDCGLIEGSNLEQYGSSISERISRDLKQLTGVSVDDVSVTFYCAEPTRRKAERQVIE